MVALAQWIEEKEPDVVAENRVWSFLGESQGRVRRTPVQVADGNWEKALVDYDWRRGPSLAQSRDRKKAGAELLARLPEEVRKAILEMFLGDRRIYESDSLGFFQEHGLLIYSQSRPGDPSSETPMGKMRTSVGPKVRAVGGKFYDENGNETKAYVAFIFNYDDELPYIPHEGIRIHSHFDIPGVLILPPSDRDISFGIGGRPHIIRKGVFDATSNRFFFIQENGEYVSYKFDEIREILEGGQ